MAVMTPRDPLGRAALRTVLIVVAVALALYLIVLLQQAAHLAGDRGVHRGRDVGAGEPARPPHEARPGDRDRLPGPGHDPDRPRGAADPLARRPDREPGRERAGVRPGRDRLRATRTRPSTTSTTSTTSPASCRASPTTCRARSATRPGVLQDIGVGVVNSIFATFTILILSIFMVGGGPRWAEAFVRAQPPGRRRAGRARAPRRRQRDRQLRRRGAGPGDARRRERVHRPDHPRAPRSPARWR